MAMGDLKKANDDFEMAAKNRSRQDRAQPDESYVQQCLVRGYLELEKLENAFQGLFKNFKALTKLFLEEGHHFVV